MNHMLSYNTGIADNRNFVSKHEPGSMGVVDLGQLVYFIWYWITHRFRRLYSNAREVTLYLVC